MDLSTPCDCSEWFPDRGWEKGEPYRRDTDASIEARRRFWACSLGGVAWCELRDCSSKYVSRVECLFCPSPAAYTATPTFLRDANRLVRNPALPTFLKAATKLPSSLPSSSSSPPPCSSEPSSSSPGVIPATASTASCAASCFRRNSLICAFCLCRSSALVRLRTHLVEGDGV